MTKKIEDHGAVAECNHPTLGYFQWCDSYWRKAVSFDHPAFEDTNILCRCRAPKTNVPDSLIRDPDVLKNRFDDWWLPVEGKILSIIEKRGLEYPGPLKVKSFTISLKKESLTEGGRWNFELETIPFLVFEGRMEGLAPLKISRVVVY